MSQTGVIFFGLLVGFIVFITLRGELQAYLSVLGLAGVGSTSPTGGSISANFRLPQLPGVQIRF